MSTRGHTTVKVAIGAVVVAVLVGYGLFQARLLIQGPTISVNSPQDGATLHSPLVAVEGSAANIASIQLNDRKIYVDESGGFTEPVVLSRGYNAITIEAQDKFGRTTQHMITIVHDPATDGDSQLSQQGNRVRPEPNESS